METVAVPFPALTVPQRVLFLFGTIAFAVTAFHVVQRCFAALCQSKKLQYEVLETRDEEEINGKVDKPVKKSDETNKTSPLELFFRLNSKLFVILIQLFLCETFIVADKPRTYSRDAYFFIVIICFAASLLQIKKTPKRGNAPVPVLFRSQTEEWRGWMQMMFVLYHVFAAAEVYKVIRVFVACYVWMTGFGNYIYFSKSKDMTLNRVLNTLWRLNFFVIVLCCTVNTPYILYYIIPLHTIFFFYVFIFFAIGKRWNDSDKGILIKFAVMGVLTFVLFDVPGVFEALEQLLLFPVEETTRHELHFRVSLDHYACLFGMAMAYNFKACQGHLNALEKLPRLRRLGLIAAVAVGLALLSGIWLAFYVPNDKVVYNSYHPYVFYFPLLLYVFVRNCSDWLRERYLPIFGWIGQITLETYLCQLHILMKQGATRLIEFVPGYPLLNTIVILIPYLFAASTLFHLTTDLRPFVIGDNPRETFRNLTLAVFVGGLLSVIVLPFNTTSFLALCLSVFLATMVVCVVASTLNLSESKAVRWIATVWQRLAAKSSASEKAAEAKEKGAAAANFSSAPSPSTEDGGSRAKTGQSWIRTAVLVVGAAVVLAIAGGLIAAAQNADGGIATQDCGRVGAKGRWLQSPEGRGAAAAKEPRLQWQFAIETVTSCGYRAFDGDHAKRTLGRYVTKNNNGAAPLLFLGDESAAALLNAVGGVVDDDFTPIEVGGNRSLSKTVGDGAFELVYLPVDSVSKAVHALSSLTSGEESSRKNSTLDKAEDLGLTAALPATKDDTHALLFIAPTFADQSRTEEELRTLLNSFENAQQSMSALPTYFSFVVSNGGLPSSSHRQGKKEDPSTDEKLWRVASIMERLWSDRDHVIPLDSRAIYRQLSSSALASPEKQAQAYGSLAHIYLNAAEKHFEVLTREKKRAAVSRRPDWGLFALFVLGFILLSKDNFFVLRGLLYLDDRLFSGAASVRKPGRASPSSADRPREDQEVEMGAVRHSSTSEVHHTATAESSK